MSPNKPLFAMVYILPLFKGYTIDIRLKQFRKVGSGLKIDFIYFDSPEGDALLAEFVGSLDAKKEGDRKNLVEILNRL